MKRGAICGIVWLNLTLGGVKSALWKIGFRSIQPKKKDVTYKYNVPLQMTLFPAN